MKLTRNRLFSTALLLILLALIFTGCQFSRKNSGIEDLTIAVHTQEELAQLDEYPDLKTLDLTGSTLDTATIGEWVAIHPWIAITHTVSIGGQTVSNDITELSLAGENCDFEELVQNLDYLPHLTSLKLHNAPLTAEQISAIADEYEDVEISLTADLLGDCLDGYTTQLDLSSIASADVEAITQQLQLFPVLTDVELMDASGSSKLTLQDVELLMAAKPETQFHYHFDLFGKTISTTDTTIEFTDTAIGNEGVAQLREALDFLTGCTYLKLDNCGIDNEVLAALQADYPNVQVVWRVFLDNYSLLTDAESLRLTNTVTDENASVLQYCTSMKYLDLSPSRLSDFSFVSHMPQLEAATLSQTYISDLTPFAGCQNLQWLEVAECPKLEDLSPLKDLTNLKYLNISTTGVTDLSVLDDLPLENLMCLNSKVPSEDRTAAEEAHPDALVRFGAGYAYGYGWRFCDYNRTYTEYYEKLAKIFGY